MSSTTIAAAAAASSANVIRIELPASRSSAEATHTRLGLLE